MARRDIPRDMPELEACLDLAGRCGAKAFEIGYLHDDVPVEEAGWWASLQYLGARIMVDEQPSPEAAAKELAARILRGATCRCGHPAVVAGQRVKPGRRVCLWTLVVRRWEPSCDAPTIHVKGKVGDLNAIHEAMGRRR